MPGLAPLADLAKWSIDAEAIEEDGKSWQNVVYEQSVVPLLVSALSIALVLAFDVGPLATLLLAVVVFYSSLPAFGSWLYYRERGVEDGDPDA